MTIMKWRAAVNKTTDVVVRFWNGQATQQELADAWEHERSVLAEWGGPPVDPKAG